MLEVGIAGMARPGEAESGDRHVSRRFRRGALVAVIDGLGHGAEAAEAASIAIAAINLRPQDSVITLVRRCHEQLLKTRGIVMSIATLDRRDETITWLCVGNIKSILLRADRNWPRNCEYLMQRSGVVGSKLPPLQASVTPIAAGDTLIMSTDGIRTGYAQHLPLASRPQQIADHILARYHDGTDDALVLVARYLGIRK